MTGFARVKKTVAEGELILSLKSVNHRGLDMHFHLPPELDALESDLRAEIKRGVARGHLQIHISFTRAEEAAAAPLNRALLDSYVRAFREGAVLYSLSGQPDLNAALRIPGMLGGAAAEELGESVPQAVLEAAAEAVTELNAVREREGAATARELHQRCQSIGGLVDRMQEIRAGSIPAFQKRLREKLADLLHGRFDYVYMGLTCVGHLRFFTRRTIEEMLTIAGWSIVKIAPQETIATPGREELLRALAASNMAYSREDVIPAGYYVIARNDR